MNIRRLNEHKKKGRREEKKERKSGGGKKRREKKESKKEGRKLEIFSEIIVNTTLISTAER